MHALIALTDFPSMPSPLSSTGPGEAWVWGDYVLTLQDHPHKVAEVMSQMTGTPLQSPPMIEYPYAVTAYYRRDRNPHGPSSRPILVVGLEKMDYAKVAALLNMPGGGMSNDGPPVLGVFTATGRFNMGSYNGAMDLDSVRQHLFSVIADHLHPAGEPVRIGPISAIHGHPDTGWPAQKKAGCMSVLLLLLAAISCLCLPFCTLAPAASPSGVRSPIGSMRPPEKYLRDFPLGVSQDELINYIGPTDSISTIGDTTYVKIDLAKKQGGGGLGVSPSMYVAVYTYVIKNGKVDNVTYQNNGLFGIMQNLDAKTEKSKHR